MPQDALSPLLARFSLRAGTFFSGPLCQRTDLYGSTDHGHLHLLHEGSLRLEVVGQPEQELAAPALLLFPRPVAHRLQPVTETAPRLACAALSFDGGSAHPLASGLPAWLVLQGDQLARLAPLFELLAGEASAPAPGHQAVLDRLFELLVIQWLRQQLEDQGLQVGLLAGLADPRLSRALALIHEQPGHPWRLEELAACAHLSRARFAARFRQVLGRTPGDYLLGWRIGLVQKGLRSGRPLALLAAENGYQSASALARAFRRHLGCSPRQWLAGLE